MRLAVPQISRRRANQFCDFVRMLELRAVSLDHHASVAEQNFSGSLHDARLSRARRTKQQEVAHRAAWRVQSGAENLVKLDQRLDAFVLANDSRAQRRFEIQRPCASFTRIERKNACTCTHGRLPAPRNRDGALPNRTPPRSNWSNLT